MAGQSSTTCRGDPTPSRQNGQNLGLGSPLLSAHLEARPARSGSTCWASVQPPPTARTARKAMPDKSTTALSCGKVRERHFALIRHAVYKDGSSDLVYTKLRSLATRPCTGLSANASRACARRRALTATRGEV
eukprot:4828766-Heterocapsa_arctica.AAC.1